ncbi:MAG: glycosyltransferase family 2 protein [Pirellulales bacterium]
MSYPLPEQYPLPDLAHRPPLAETVVSVVLPVFNEEAVLTQLVDAIRQAVSGAGADYEIVFVDDGSTDRSGLLLDGMAAKNERVRVVHFSRNFGHQAAVLAGLVHATGDCVVLMDSDLQDAPDAIPRFLAEWQGGYDVVYAVRTQRKEHAVKRLLFTTFYRLLASISSTPLPLDAGNFGLIDRRVVREIVALGERDRYFAGLRSWVGFRQRGVVVERLARYDDQPRVSLLGLLRLAKTAVFSFSTLPVRAFTLIGFTALGVFTLLGGFSLFCRLFTNLAIPGWTSGILSASFFGALNALGISILGEYVIRIYDQVRGRPVYIVDRTVNLAGSERAGATTSGGSYRSASAAPTQAQLNALADATRGCVEQTALDVAGDFAATAAACDLRTPLSTPGDNAVNVADARASIVPPT